MTQEKIITGTEGEIWQQITDDFNKESDFLEYRVMIEQQNRRVLLDIDIDLGGGFEGGYESTLLRSQIKSTEDFRFATHHESFIDEVGKFFGMQDVVVGFPEFDQKVIIKSNDETRVKSIFSDTSVRGVFQALDNYTFGVIMHHLEGKDKSPCLELNIDSAITDPVELKRIYCAFFKVLILIDTD